MMCACCMEHVCKIVWHQWVPAKASSHTLHRTLEIEVKGHA